MDFTALIDSIEASPIGEWLRTSQIAFPIVETLHVIALATVFGTIFIVDLRLLGYPSTNRPVTRVSDELLKWTWGGFALAVVTGVMMFTANAHVYFENTEFRLKMLVLLLAGLNMAVFQFVTYRNVASWDKDVAPPIGARVAGALSMLLWTTVIFLGRWIGFTKGYDYDIPDDMDLDLDFDFSALQQGLERLSDILPT